MFVYSEQMRTLYEFGQIKQLVWTSNNTNVKKIGIFFLQKKDKKL